MPCYYPALYYGGPVTAVHQMNAALVKKGVDVTVYTTDANGPNRLKTVNGEEVVIDGVRVNYFSQPFLNPYFYCPEISHALRRNLNHFDLVHINWLYVYTTLVAARLCIKNNMPYILSPHGMLDYHASRKKGRLKKRIYLKVIEGKHLRNASRIHFASLGEQENAVTRHWNLNNAVVPNGLDTSGLIHPQGDSLLLQKYPELDKKKIVLSIGRLSHIKGLDLLINAWSLVLDRFKDVHLVIAGPDKNGYRDILERLCRDLKISDKITFTGMIEGREKAELLGLSSIFVSASYLESFGMSIVEAMVCSIPVVITDRVNIKSEISQANAGRVAACDAESIASEICYMLENPEAAIAMGIKGKELASQNYDINKASEAMLNLYNKTIATF